VSTKTTKRKFKQVLQLSTTIPFNEFMVHDLPAAVALYGNICATAEYLYVSSTRHALFSPLAVGVRFSLHHIRAARDEAQRPSRQEFRFSLSTKVVKRNTQRNKEWYPSDRVKDNTTVVW
jgi:hypothetical protein